MWATKIESFTFRYFESDDNGNPQPKEITVQADDFDKAMEIAHAEILRRWKGN